MPAPMPVAIPEKGMMPGADGAAVIDDVGVARAFAPGDVVGRAAVRRPARHPVDEERGDVARPVGALPGPLGPGRVADAAMADPSRASRPRQFAVMTLGLRQVASIRRHAGGRRPSRRRMPPDPRQALSGPLDPSLEAIRAALAPHRRRLWLRRIVRRDVDGARRDRHRRSRAVDGGSVRTPRGSADRSRPPSRSRSRWSCSWSSLRARPSLGETALAVDVEGGLGDRVSSALELAVGVPRHRRRHPPTTSTSTRRSLPSMRSPRPIDSSADSGATRSRRCGRRRRCSSRGSRETRRSPPWSRSRCSCPVVVLPNPQDAVIAQQRDVREAADRQADRLDDIARGPRGQGPRLPRIRGHGSRRSCATWLANCASSPTSSPPTCASSVPSRATSGRASTLRPSSEHRR